MPFALQMAAPAPAQAPDKDDELAVDGSSHTASTSQLARTQQQQQQQRLHEQDDEEGQLASMYEEICEVLLAQTSLPRPAEAAAVMQDPAVRGALRPCAPGELLAQAAVVG
jgi:hypothetical protein